MLTLFFVCMMFAVLGKMIGLAFKATWGITKVLFSFVLFPVILLILVICGLVYVALPILVVVGILSLIDSAGIA